MSKLINKFLRPIGLFFIFTFAVLCIFESLFVRDLDPSSYFTKFMEYTSSFESRFYDYRMRSQLDPDYVSKDVALITIDDYSLQKIGIWPLPRAKHADMMNRLNHFGAKVAALDIMYPEKAPVCGETSPDTILARAFKDFKNSEKHVFLAYSTGSDQTDSLKEAPLEMLDNTIHTESTSDINLTPWTIGKYSFPIEEFMQAGVGVGSIGNHEDPDGIFRQYLLLLNIDTIYFGSLGYNAVASYTGINYFARIHEDGTATLYMLDISAAKKMKSLADVPQLELNNRGETRIRWRGGLDNFATVSLYDLLSAKDNDPKIRAALNGKIVFVGSTALGAHDLRPSPIDSKMPGVLAHMNMSQMLLDQYFYRPTNESVEYSLYVLLAGMLIFFLAHRVGSALVDILILLVMVGGSYYIDQVYFIPKGYELRLFYCYFCFVASYSFNTFLNFSEANKEKKQIKGTFARYVAPTIVDEMLKDPEKLQVGGTKRDITCLFSDVRDFTTISEGLSASDLAHSLNMYMGRMTDIVFETKGTLDKYIGDAIVAFWGAPLEIGNHAQYAVEGAIRMMNDLPAINEEFLKLGRPEFKVGIGLNSGECNVGNMGSERIFSYTALGDNMNLGARLESLCKRYGAHILISEYTLSRIDSSKMKIRPIDRVIVKGKTRPVAIFEVLHGWHPMTKNPLAFDSYIKGHALFMDRKFSAAMGIFEQLTELLPEDKPSKRMKELCKKFVEMPPLPDEEFDVTKMTEK